jgi:sulfite exporter TauE/SafE
MNVWMLFIAGLLTGFHCLTMCGNLVIGYSLRCDRTVGIVNHVLYNAARLGSYTLTGVLLGYLGQAVNIAAFGGTATLAGGIFLIFFALKMFGFFSGRKLPEIPGTRSLREALGRIVARLRTGAGNRSAYVPEVSLGALSGFMPCAPLQAAQIYAAGTGSPLEGGLAMLSFGVGTIPMLFLYGYFAGRISVDFREKMARAFAVVVLVLGLVLLNRGLALVNSPVTATKIVGYAKEALAWDRADATAGQTVRIRIERTAYEPREIRVPANTPVTLEVFRNEDVVCSNELWIPELGIRQPLAPFGVTRIELPPLKEGIYQVTCQMGMMDGRLVVGSVGGVARMYMGLALVLVGGIGMFLLLRGGNNEKAPARAATRAATHRTKGARK